MLGCLARSPAGRQEIEIRLKRTCHHSPIQLLAELELYNSALLEKPIYVVANKMDEPTAEENLKKFKRRIRKTPVLPIAAAFDQGIDLFKKMIREAVEEASSAAAR